MTESISVEDIRELRDERIGLYLTALIAGVRSPDRVNTWCAGQLAPSPEQARRLSFALAVLREVARSEKSWDIARAWFIGGDVGDELVSPAEAIRMDRFKEVRVSAQKLIEDVPFSA